MSGFTSAAGSQTSSLPTGPLSDAERNDVRRFCGYMAFGNGSQGFQSWRFFDQYGVLEFRMSNLAPAELQTVRYYLTTLYCLEADIPGAAANLDTDQVSVWVHNKNEVADRARLYDQWRSRLAGYLGIPLGDDLKGRPGTGGGAMLVV